MQGSASALKRAKIVANEPGSGNTAREDTSFYSVDHPESPESLENQYTRPTIYYLPFRINHDPLTITP
jgi:hypothetical protein